MPNGSARRPAAGRVPSAMTAVVLDRFGGADEFSLRRIPVPRVGDDDVLVRVEYAGVGSWDVVERAGDYDGVFGIAASFPYVLGWDAAGTVAAVGQNVDRFEVGDRVYAATIPVARGGFYAEYGVVDADHVAHVPERFPTLQAGAMGWDALTAMRGLDLLDLGPDHTLMIFGASGGIGHMALQMATQQGMRVLAVASGPDGVALARRLGADGVVDGRTDDPVNAASEFAASGFDAALFTAGGDVAERLLGAVKSSGLIAWPNGVEPTPTTTPEASIRHYDAARDLSATSRLNAYIDAGSFEVHVAQTFPLERVADAHAAASGHHLGKLALTMAPTGHQVR